MVGLTIKKLGTFRRHRLIEFKSSFERGNVRCLSYKISIRFNRSEEFREGFFGIRDMLENVVANDEIENIVGKWEGFAIDAQVARQLWKQVAANILSRWYSGQSRFYGRFGRNMENRAVCNVVQQSCLRHIEPEVAVTIVAAATRAKVVLDVGADPVDQGNEWACGGDVGVR